MLRWVPHVSTGTSCNIKFDKDEPLQRPVYSEGVLDPQRGNQRADYGSTSAQHNDHRPRTLRRSLEPVSVLRRVVVSGPIKALAARQKVNIFGRRSQARKDPPCCVDVQS